MKAYKVKRRKVFLINKEVQVRFVLASLVYIVVYSFVLASLVFIPVAYSLLTKSSLPEQYEAATAFIALHTYLWPALLIVFVFVAIHSIRFTHRVVGPIHRMKKTIGLISNDNLSETVVLRRHDFFKDMEEEINNTISHLRGNVDYIGLKKQELSEAVTQLIDALGKDSGEEAVSKAEKIKRIEEDLERFLSKFQRV